MINKTSSTFSIKDLQNISGIKIPTIRMWEKRYDVFSPQRTATNIRFYDNNDLCKLLNISFLQNHGFKISKLAKLSPSELDEKVKETYDKQNNIDAIINEFIICILNYDKVQFFAIYERLIDGNNFNDVFTKFFIPLLERIGLLWQTSTINPMHEHFISNLILQKLHANIDAVSNTYKPKDRSDKCFILFLPENEIHELGILFVYYNLLLKNKHAIYLGENVAIDQLQQLTELSETIVFITNITINPNNKDLSKYLNLFGGDILVHNHELWATGYQLNGLQETINIPSIHLFESLKLLIDNV